MVRDVSQPSPETLAWAARAVAPGATVADARPIGGATGPWVLDIRGAAVATVVLRVGELDDANVRRRFGVESTALRLAEHHGIGAPRLIGADLDGAAPSQLKILSSFLAGTSAVPAVATHERLAALGRAVAELSRTKVTGAGELPVRHCPLSDLDFAATRAAGDTTPLLDAGQRYLSEAPLPTADHVLVHGDCWQGNMLWSDNEFVGFVDWDAAGTGPPGVDLGSLRCDVAMYFGLAATDAVYEGWQAVTGEPFELLAYWDVVAALSTPTDLSEWMPVIEGQGGPVVDARTVTDARDEFLESALDRIGRS